MGLFEDVMQDSVNNVVGKVEKAFLIFNPYKNDTITSSNIIAQASSALSQVKNATPESLLNQVSGVSGVSVVKKQVTTVGENGQSTTSEELLSADVPISPSTHVLEVQYNPASLRLQANAETVRVQYLQNKLENGLPQQQTLPPSVVLSVELVFDAVNIYDAFMAEKVSSAVTNPISAQTARNVKSAVESAGTKKTAPKVWSVQPQTNALLAMLMRNSTRTVTFKWANMTFTGEASEVNARYTMFSPSGRPVRSVVQLNITQKVEDNAALEYWSDAFDAQFKEESSGGKSAFQKAGNLINIGF